MCTCVVSSVTTVSAVEPPSTTQKMSWSCMPWGTSAGSRSTDRVLQPRTEIRGPATAAASPETLRSPAELPGMTHCTFHQNLDNLCNAFAVVVPFHSFILYFDIGVALGTAISRTFLHRHLGLMFMFWVNELLARACVFSPRVHSSSRR